MRKLILLSLLFAAPDVFAQSNYSVLSGSVVDQRPSSIVGASAEFTSLSTHAVGRVTSNEQGEYSRSLVCCPMTTRLSFRRRDSRH